MAAFYLRARRGCRHVLPVISLGPTRARCRVGVTLLSGGACGPSAACDGRWLVFQLAHDLLRECQCRLWQWVSACSGDGCGAHDQRALSVQQEVTAAQGNRQVHNRAEDLAPCPRRAKRSGPRGGATDGASAGRACASPATAARGGARGCPVPPLRVPTFGAVFWTQFWGHRHISE